MQLDIGAVIFVSNGARLCCRLLILCGGLALVVGSTLVSWFRSAIRLILLC